MKPNTQLIPFCGYPIVKIETGELLYNNELNFLKALDTREQIEYIDESTNTAFRLTKGVHILDNVELLRVRDFIWNNFCEYVDDVLEIENLLKLPPENNVSYMPKNY